MEDATRCIDVSVDCALAKFVHVLHEAASCMRQQVFVGGRVQHRNKWFDKECRELKRKVNHYLRRYRSSRSIKDKKEYMQIRLQYFKVIKEKKQIYRQSFYDTLLRNRNDSKKFWSAIKRVRPRESNQIPITLDEWREHFEGVLGQCSMTANTDYCRGGKR